MSLVSIGNRIVETNPDFIDVNNEFVASQWRGQAISLEKFS